jgi:hypothetical protein
MPRTNRHILPYARIPSRFVFSLFDGCHPPFPADGVVKCRTNFSFAEYIFEPWILPPEPLEFTEVAEQFSTLDGHVRNFF